MVWAGTTSGRVKSKTRMSATSAVTQQHSGETVGLATVEKLFKIRDIILEKK